MDTQKNQPDTSFALDDSKLQKLLKLAQTNQVQSILEFGSGQSTAAFCRVLKDAYVLSVESSAHYLEATRQLCDSADDLHQKPILTHRPLRWQTHSKRLYLSYDLSTPKDEIQTNRFDLCFIDGPVQNHTLAGREFILYKVFDRLNEGAIIALDDSHRKESKLALKNWLHTFGSALQVIHTEEKMIVLRKTSETNPKQQALGGCGWLKHHLKIPTVIYKQARYSAD